MRHLAYLVLFVLLAPLACSEKEQTGFYELNERVRVYTDPSFSPPKNGKKQTAKPSPEGMIYIPGDYVYVGAEDGMEWERPRFWVYVKPLFMDIHPVTVAAFRKFVEATGYISEAEKFGDAAVLDETTLEWTLRKGTTWKYPLGTEGPPSIDDHPVTQVSWNDAKAYAEWAGKRLPYEYEWEHAARNGKNDQSKYPWGEELLPEGAHKANLWQGTFPTQNKVEDGFVTTSPVGHFGKTPLGLTDMAGNVWEWCEDWRIDPVDILMRRDPPKRAEKVERGGSFLCEASWCHGWRVSGKAFTSPESSLMNVGFRCVRDAD